MSNESETATGVERAWDFWLSQHPVTLADIIEVAVKAAVAKWLDDNEETLISRISMAAARTMAKNDSNEQRADVEGAAASHCSLDVACWMLFGGVCAMSPELYGRALAKIAELTGRVNDAQLRCEVEGVLRTFPCQLD